MNEYEFRIHLNHKLCEIADLLMFHYNPCNLDKEGNCYGGNIGKCCHHTYYEKKDKTGCIFLNKNGCTVNNFGCKIWFCNESFDKLPRELKLTLKSLEIIDRLYALSTYPTEHWQEDKKGYKVKDLLRYFDEEL